MPRNLPDEPRPRDPNSTPTIAERRRLLDVNRAAAMFYRRELLRAKKSWARTYLTDAGVGEVLDPGSSWAIGYAPDSRSRLVDSLRSRGFDLASVRNAGLGLLDPDDRTIDRLRDHLILPARNERLETVGFIGMRTTTAPYYMASPASQVYRRSNALVGVAEQLDLLSEGAVPVLVNHPVDALAVERISRLSIGRWAGIPLCDTLLSVQQAALLARYTSADTAIVAVPHAAAAQRAATGFLDDLNRFFPRIWAVELPSMFPDGPPHDDQTAQQALHDALLVTRPLSDYRRPKQRRPRRQDGPASEAPGHGPEL
ncbi:hypothetical protein ACFV9C_32725 [Kribbella sp. NPDC059898]|uniref:hypothetical protein n=1 Tax=Kribbella sp. NPDC059898 TaxID=3346995 RepID=UPI003663542F